MPFGLDAATRVRAQLRALGRRSARAAEMMRAAGFVLYTLLVVNLVLLVRPVFRLGSSIWHRDDPGALDGWRPARRRRRRASSNLSHEDSAAHSHGLAARRAATPRRALSVVGRAAPPTSALLTTLPLELRQEIYRLVLAGRRKQFIRLGGDDYAHPTDFVLNDADYRTRDSVSGPAGVISTPRSLLLPLRVSPLPRRVAARSSQGSLLALPLTCRQVYAEAIGLVYRSVVFKVSRLFTVADLAAALLPQRFAALRSLEISYELRCGLPLRRAVAIGEDADWRAAWTLMAERMPGLQTLRVDLFAFDVRALVPGEGDDAALVPVDDESAWRWLQPVLRVRQLRTCDVKLNHVRRFNDTFVAAPPVSWFMLLVMDALERLMAARMTGRRVDRESPFGLPPNEKVAGLWQTVLALEEQALRADAAVKTSPEIKMVEGGG